jgi:hypothetical protein
MENWEFLIQKEGDQAWLSLESDSTEILEGSYRVMVRSDFPSQMLDIQISHCFEQEGQPRRHHQRRSQSTDPAGLLDIIPFTYFQAGVWKLACKVVHANLDPSVVQPLAFNAESFWQQSIQIQVLPKTADLGDDEPLLDFEFVEPMSEPQRSLVPENQPKLEVKLSDEEQELEILLEKLEINRQTEEQDLDVLLENMMEEVASLDEVFTENPLVRQTARPFIPFGSQDLQSEFFKSPTRPSPLVLLDQSAFTSQVGESITLSGQAFETGDLLVSLRDALTQELWFQRKLTLSGQSSPISFVCRLDLPLISQVLVGEARLLSRDQSKPADFRDAQPFMVTVVAAPIATPLPPKSQPPAVEPIKSQAREGAEIPSQSIPIQPLLNPPLTREPLLRELRPTPSTDRVPAAKVSDARVPARTPAEREPAASEPIEQERIPLTAETPELISAEGKRLELPVFNLPVPPLEFRRCQTWTLPPKLQSSSAAKRSTINLKLPVLPRRVADAQGHESHPRSRVGLAELDLPAEFPLESPTEEVRYDFQPLQQQLRQGLKLPSRQQSVPEQAATPAVTAVSPLAELAPAYSQTSLLIPDGITFESLQLARRFWLRLSALARDVQLLPPDSTQDLVTSPESNKSGLEPSSSGETVKSSQRLASPQLPQMGTPPISQVLPVPELLPMEAAWIAGYPFRVKVQLPPFPPTFQLGVKLWVAECSTRSLMTEPRWLTDFSYNQQLGCLEAIAEFTLTVVNQEVMLRAVTVDINTQQQSHKTTITRHVKPR